jgi:site-specific recombinase XerD
MGSQYNPEEYSPILREFAGYKLVIQACSPRTVSEYMLDLRAFFKYIISKKNKIPYGTPAYEDISVKDVDLALISSVATSDIYDFLLFCEKEFGNASAARARKLSAIKGLYKYLVTKRGLIENNPSVNIETPKKRRA